jgi:hypothetical protein
MQGVLRSSSGAAKLMYFEVAGPCARSLLGNLGLLE